MPSVECHCLPAIFLDDVYAHDTLRCRIFGCAIERETDGHWHRLVCRRCWRTFFEWHQLPPCTAPTPPPSYQDPAYRPRRRPI